MDTQIKLTASSQTTPKEIETIFQQNVFMSNFINKYVF